MRQQSVALEHFAVSRYLLTVGIMRPNKSDERIMYHFVSFHLNVLRSIDNLQLLPHRSGQLNPAFA